MGAMWQECGWHFSVPKLVDVKNKRLGILHRCLQIIFFAAAIASVVWNKGWLEYHSPLPYGFAFWLSSADAATKFDDTVKHCRDTSSYYYVYSPAWVYAPTSCKPLDSSRSLMKTRSSSQWVYAPTFIQETQTSSTSGAECGALFEANCTARGGTHSKLDEGKGCECSVTSEYFVQNAELNYLSMLHGYTVNKNQQGTSNQKGVSTFNAQTHTDRRAQHLGLEAREWEEEDVEIVTTFINKGDGKLCEFGGKEEWTPEDVRGGLSISFKELLECVGLDLDQQYEELRSFDAAENMAPYLRQSGAIINAYMNFENQQSRGLIGFTDNKVYCTVLLDGSLTWNSQQENYLVETPTSRSNWSEEIDLYMYGISFDVQVTGSFAYFSIFELLNALVKVIVLATVPTKIMSLICLYMLGHRSKIYQRVVKERFSVPSYVSGLIGRKASHSAAFQMISKQLHLQVNQLGSMPMKDFERVIRALLREYTSSGVVSEAELTTLCSYLHKHYDKDGDGHIDLHRWVTMSMSNEPMSLHDIASLFDVDRKKSCGERIFDDGIAHHIEKVYEAHVIRAESAELEDGDPDQLARSPSSNKLPVSRQEFAALQERLLQLEARLGVNGEKREDAGEQNPREEEGASEQTARQAQLSAPVGSETLKELEETLQQHTRNCTQLLSKEFLEDFHKIVEGHARALQQLFSERYPHSGLVAGQETTALSLLSEPAAGRQTAGAARDDHMKLVWEIAELKGQFSALDKEVGSLSSALRSRSQSPPIRSLGTNIPPLASSQFYGRMPLVGAGQSTPPSISF
eukprot:TRINITY_DN2257_c0_g1_i1.p1 TRINITY_DN2257_c0_g1~~TRINITY_DN2257_c0_g1_i1.p1  ORF type:complete len:800 (+),score=131.88 TRINITY_DN2257_c0_g1_i1:72-2471(+)